MDVVLPYVENMAVSGCYHLLQVAPEVGPIAVHEVDRSVACN